MKKALIRIDNSLKKIELNIPHPSIITNYNIYKCLALSTVETVDIEEYCSTAARCLISYLSMDKSMLHIEFINGFYETYRMFDESSILISDSDKTSHIYDSSMEARIARVLAIGDKLHYDFMAHVEEICSELE